MVEKRYPRGLFTRESQSDMSPFSSLSSRPAEKRAPEIANPARNTPYPAGIRRRRAKAGVVHVALDDMCRSLFIDSQAAHTEYRRRLAFALKYWQCRFVVAMAKGSCPMGNRSIKFVGVELIQVDSTKSRPLALGFGDAKSPMKKNRGEPSRRSREEFWWQRHLSLAIGSCCRGPANLGCGVGI